MTVTNPMTVAREQLLALLTPEFAADGYEIKGDVIHKSLGRDGRTRIGVSPAREQPYSENLNVMRYRILVQFYGGWPDQIDPETQVDPTAIETQAERFKRSLRGNDPATPSMWFFNLEEISYPMDPTGNATRFEALVEAVGNNSALVETIG